MAFVMVEIELKSWNLASPTAHSASAINNEWLMVDADKSPSRVCRAARTSTVKLMFEPIRV